MKKLAVFVLMFAVYCLAAGVYGVLHDQISYTVSPEYFTRFKFEQFDIAPALPERLGAALVGWQATWWMGLAVGAVLIPFGLIIPGWRPYLRGLLGAIAVVALTALLAGLAGLAVGALTYDSVSEQFGQFRLGDGSPPADPRRFYVCGSMHNYSYAGGLFGAVTGVLWIVRRRVLARRALAGARSGDSPRLGPAGPR